MTYTPARPPAHWVDWPSTTYGLVGAPEFSQWDATLTDLRSAVLYATDYGVVADGTTDNLTAAQAAINDAYTLGKTLIWPCGQIACSARLTTGTTTSARMPPLRMIGAGGAGSRFHALFSVPIAPTTFIRTDPAGTWPILYHYGYGLNLENIGFDGQFGVGPLAQLAYAFEPRFKDVRFYRSGAQALILTGCDNGRFKDVHIDNCGSATAPALRIDSNTDVPLASNTIYFENMHLERNTGVDIDIATGASGTTTDYAEFVIFNGLHVEGSFDSNTPNLSTDKTQNMIEVGNARGVLIANSFIYGGPGSLIHMNTQGMPDASKKSSVHISNSYLLGNGNGGAKPARHVDLQAGDAFSMSNCILDYAGTEYVRIQSTFAGTVNAGPNTYLTSRSGSTATLVTDSRATPAPVGIDGDFSPATRYFATSSGKPTVVAVAPGNGTSPPAPTVPTGSNDVRGHVLFGSGTTPTTGQQITVTFNKAFAAAPIVAISPRNDASAGLQAYVGVNTTAFAIYAHVAPAGGQSSGTYDFSYVVIG